MIHELQEPKIPSLCHSGQQVTPNSEGTIHQFPAMNPDIYPSFFSLSCKKKVHSEGHSMMKPTDPQRPAATESVFESPLRILTQFLIWVYRDQIAFNKALIPYTPVPPPTKFPDEHRQTCCSSSQTTCRLEGQIAMIPPVNRRMKW